MMKENKIPNSSDEGFFQINGQNLGWSPEYIAYVVCKAQVREAEQALKKAEEHYTTINGRLSEDIAFIAELTDAYTWILQAQINLLADKTKAGIAYYKLMKSHR